MTDEEIAKVADGVVLLPVTVGEIVLAYNLPGSPKGLKLPRDVYPNIFLGKVTKWNDPRIAAANPNLKLPDLLITVVRRSYSSGTTFVFTNHLSAISEAFAKEVGSGTTVQWPIFIAELSNWDFSVQVPDSDFVFQPPAGVTQVELKPSRAPTTPQ